MPLSVVVAVAVVVAVIAALRTTRAHRRDAVARRISGGRKALVSNLFGR